MSYRKPTRSQIVTLLLLILAATMLLLKRSKLRNFMRGKTPI